MTLPRNKTKLVCTIGPACETPESMLKLMKAGMNIARLNFSHGEFSWHADIIKKLREAARISGKRLSIMADLPGPKMRIGEIAKEPIQLKRGEQFTLTIEKILGNQERVSVSFSRLPVVVKPGDRLFLNDGNIQLEVLATNKTEVKCTVQVGGELRSRKGLNLPRIDLGISAFTPHDHACMQFALEHGVDALSQSFVETAADIEAVRDAASSMGKNPFIIAKIERSGALNHIDDIMQAADGIMIARGDLGVETPIEQMAIVQKKLTHRANQLGKPVITATQMLESMVDNNRPTRAEATDVANAILDGSDCVMLSGESAMGKFPIEAVQMLAGIAAETEPYRTKARIPKSLADYDRNNDTHLVDLISRNVQHTVKNINPTAILVPTVTGHTARMISRFHLPVWIAAVSPDDATCGGLQFSYGVAPICEPTPPDNWNNFAKQWVQKEGLEAGAIVLTEGPSPNHPTANPRMEIIHLDGEA